MKSLIGTLRTLLILGRVSNLPTVWSNIIVGWFLVGGGIDCAPLVLLLLGGSLLYTGGMYLNDFCDASFDARYCPQRPIPFGKISRRAVGIMAVLWFVTGFLFLASFGPLTAGIALLLIAVIVLYDFRHKDVAWAPLIMGACRLLLYPLAASASRSVTCGIILGVVPMAVALGLYVAGITYLARGESRPGKPARWALLFLLLPVMVSWGMYALRNSPDPSASYIPLFLLGLLQLIWMLWLLVPFWRKTSPSIGRVVSGLLAGIVLVDMIALGTQLDGFAIGLYPLFLLALLLQRVIPAT